MPTTPVYGFPYPADTNSPNVPADMQSALLAVESKFATVDSVAVARIPFHGEGVATSDTTLATSVTDLPGATVTFTTTSTNATVIVEAVFDWRLTGTGTGYCYGEFAVDGTTNGRKALFVAQSTETRLPGPLRRKLTIASIGSHTIKLQCHKDSSSGTALFCADTTTLGVTVYN